MRALISLCVGGLFGLGLIVSDMVDPARVRAFLDLAGGAWDPTLGFVMAGALAVMGIAWRVAADRERPFYAERFPPMPEAGVDRRLVTGAICFGIGWGLIGFCPGPALAALTLGGLEVAIFVAAMLVGMLLHASARRRAA